MAEPALQDPGLSEQEIETLLRAEELGIISNRDRVFLKGFRERGLIPQDAFGLADTSPLPFDEIKEKRRATTVGGPNVPATVDIESLEKRRFHAQKGIGEKTYRG